MHTRFILIQPSHAGNVGAVARAMKVMGFDDLVLLNPRWADVLQRDETIERASGAADILQKAQVVHAWQDAVAGIEHLCATAMTARDFGPPTVQPRPHFAQIVNTAAVRSVGLVFGCERFGMRNDDVYRCHASVSIATNPDYGSLNLAAAVQVLAYEWRQALGGFVLPHVHTIQPKRADAAQIEGMLQHWQQALEHIGYLDPKAPKKLMPRLQQLAHRAQLQDNEIHIARGIAKAVLEIQINSKSDPS